MFKETPNEIYCKPESINFKIELKNIYEYLLKANWNLTTKWMNWIPINSKLNIIKLQYIFTHTTLTFNT
jgi:hypothetical protein